MLILIKDHLHYEIIGTTRDDAAGEAFDKVARLLQLGYPGGPEISQQAESGDPTAYQFPRGMAKSGDLDFSFSGLKTAVYYTLKDAGYTEKPAPQAVVTNVAASFQQAVVDSLLLKVTAALKQHSVNTLLLAGGVAANTALRQAMTNLAEETNTPLHVAPLPLCGDNALMIGLVGLLAHAAGRTQKWDAIDATARLDINSVQV